MDFNGARTLAELTYDLEAVPAGDKILRGMKGLAEHDGMSASWHRNEMAAGRFPQPFLITPTTPGWFASWVTKNMLARAAGLE